MNAFYAFLVGIFMALAATVPVWFILTRRKQRNANSAQTYQSTDRKLRKKVTLRDQLLRQFENAGKEVIRARSNLYDFNLPHITDPNGNRTIPIGEIYWPNSNDFWTQGSNALICVEIDLRKEDEKERIRVWRNAEHFPNYRDCTCSRCKHSKYTSEPRRFGTTPDERQRAVEYIRMEMVYISNQRKEVENTNVSVWT